MSDPEFLARRERLTRTWKPVGTVLLLALACLAGWLHLTAPRLVHPFRLADEIARGSLDRPTIEFMALLLPFAVLALLGLVAAVVLLAFVVFATEKRYLEIIAGPRTQGGPPQPEKRS